MKTCPYCNAPIPDASMKFCGQCGMKLDYEEGAGSDNNLCVREGVGRSEPPQLPPPSAGNASAPPPVNTESNAERRDIEKRLSSLGHTGCLDIEPLVVNVILAFFLPFLWVPVVVWVVATIVAHARRGEARGALKANSVEVAKAALATAKTWYGIRFTASLALWGTEFYGIYLLLKGFASFAEALQSL